MWLGRWIEGGGGRYGGGGWAEDSVGKRMWRGRRGRMRRTERRWSMKGGGGALGDGGGGCTHCSWLSMRSSPSSSSSSSVTGSRSLNAPPSPPSPPISSPSPISLTSSISLMAPLRSHRSRARVVWRVSMQVPAQKPNNSKKHGLQKGAGMKIVVSDLEICIWVRGLRNHYHIRNGVIWYEHSC
jgi:hypothetical protein